MPSGVRNALPAGAPRISFFTIHPGSLLPSTIMMRSMPFSVRNALPAGASRLLFHNLFQHPVTERNQDAYVHCPGS